MKVRQGHGNKTAGKSKKDTGENGNRNDSTFISDLIHTSNRFVSESSVGQILVTGVALGLVLIAIPAMIHLRPIWWLYIGLLIIFNFFWFLCFWVADQRMIASKTQPVTAQPAETPPIATESETKSTPDAVASTSQSPAGRRLPKIILVNPELAINIGGLVSGDDAILHTINGNGVFNFPYSALGPNILFTLRVQDKILGVEANITDGQQTIHLTITSPNGGEVKVDGLPYDWDVNGDATGVEVVDGNGVPVFQVEYVKPRLVKIMGIFDAGGDKAVLGLDGKGGIYVLMKSDPTKITAMRKSQLMPIFRYPSSLQSVSGPSFDGVRLGVVTPQPPPGKNPK